MADYNKKISALEDVLSKKQNKSKLKKEKPLLVVKIISKKKKFGVPNGTGPYGRGMGPGKGKADGSGKDKNEE